MKVKIRRTPKIQEREGLKRFASPAAAAGAGAAVMYFLDPRNGRRRRAMTRDRGSALARAVARRTGQRGRYYAGKRHGVSHGLRGPSGDWDANDATVQHKIESEVLRDYPRGRINVNVEEGVAVLRGQLDRPEEIRRLFDEVQQVPGVRDVRNLVHLPGTAPPGYERVRDGIQPT